MHKTELAQKLGITVKRLATITTALFECEKLVFDEPEISQVKGVIEFMQQKNEASVRKAVALYKEGVATATKLDPRNQNLLNLGSGNREGGVATLSQEQYQMARKRAIKQAVAIQETSQSLLADFLEFGIPLDEISEEQLEVLEISGDKVYEAALGKYDSVGNYLPALAQPRMLSAAID
jgi:NACalpha-BTF3-like transcription factor